MLSLFTALFTNAMQASLDGTRCRDIDDKEVNESTCSINSWFHHRFPCFLYQESKGHFSVRIMLYFSQPVYYIPSSSPRSVQQNICLVHETKLPNHSSILLYSQSV